MVNDRAVAAGVKGLDRFAAPKAHLTPAATVQSGNHWVDSAGRALGPPFCFTYLPSLSIVCIKNLEGK